MVDTENEIFTVISNVAKTANTKCEVSSVYPSQLGKFPFVLAEQSDEYPTHMTQSTEPKYHRIAWTIDVYSNDTVKRKSICKKIGNAIQEELENYNFTCTAKTPMQDTTTYRLTYRFEAETDGERYYRR